MWYVVCVMHSLLLATHHVLLSTYYLLRPYPPPRPCYCLLTVNYTLLTTYCITCTYDSPPFSAVATSWVSTTSPPSSNAYVLMKSSSLPVVMEQRVRIHVDDRGFWMGKWDLSPILPAR